MEFNNWIWHCILIFHCLTVIEKVAGCTDTATGCKGWASRGFCTDPRYASYVRPRCCLSCKDKVPQTEQTAKTIYERQKNNQWFKDGISRIEDALKFETINKKAKGAVLFIGDGMGPSSVTAIRILDGQNKGKQGEENVLSWEKFPNVALSKTYTVDTQVADSAGSATAYLTGVKARNGVLGVDENTKYGSCSSSKNHEVLSIIMMAEEAGLSTGVVTTTEVTHATPGATYSHSASRKWYANAPKGCKDIASQAIDFNYGDGLEVLMGGGRNNFLPKLKGGARRDGRDLISEWKSKSTSSKKFEYISNRAQLKAKNPENVDHLLGLFAHKHFEYKARSPDTQPTLEEMTELAIGVLKKNPKGFVLLVEGGKIDHGHHANSAQLALTEGVELAKAVEKASQITSKDEVLLLTSADHSHVFTLGGFPKRGNPILGLEGRTANDKKKMTTLMYANGPSAKVSSLRDDPGNYNFRNPSLLYQSLVPLRGETHGGEDVGIYARGPQAHLVNGVVEQNYIFHVMDYALCLSESKKAICKREGLIP